MAYLEEMDKVPTRRLIHHQCSDTAQHPPGGGVLEPVIGSYGKLCPILKEISLV